MVGNMLFLIAIPVVVIIIISIILSIVFRNSEKVEKGFEFVYYKLTYRRKMVRTIISLPIVIICMAVIYHFSMFSMTITLIILGGLILSVVIQFVYNYMMWNKYEREK